MDKYNPYGLKYYCICQEVSGSILAKTLELLFKGRKPVEKHLESKLRHGEFYEGERFALEQLKDGSKNLHDLDVCLLLRLIQRTCGLAPPHHNVWHCKCKINKRIILEHCLFRVKELRNEAVHEFRFMLRNMSSKQFEVRKAEMEKLFKIIINQVCSRKKLPFDEMERWKTSILDSLKEISAAITIVRTEEAQPRRGERSLCREDSVDGISYVPIAEHGLHEIRSKAEEEMQEISDEQYIAAWNAQIPSKNISEIISEYVVELGSPWSIKIIGIAFVCYYVYKKVGKLTLI